MFWIAADSDFAPMIPAAPPIPCSMADRKSSVLILPASMSLRISSTVLPVVFASRLSSGIPLSVSIFISSADTLPFAATLLNTAPISDISVPATDAASATRLRYLVSSCPGFIPAATADADVVAASPSPNAVPFTDSSAESITFCISGPSIFRPSSFAFAWSIAFNLSKPFLSEIPAKAAPAATAGLVRYFVSFAPVFEKPSPIFEISDLASDTPFFSLLLSSPVSNISFPSLIMPPPYPNILLNSSICAFSLSVYSVGRLHSYLSFLNSLSSPVYVR